MRTAVGDLIVANAAVEKQDPVVRGVDGGFHIVMTAGVAGQGDVAVPRPPPEVGSHGGTLQRAEADLSHVSVGEFSHVSVGDLWHVSVGDLSHVSVGDLSHASVFALVVDSDREVEVLVHVSFFEERQQVQQPADVVSFLFVLDGAGCVDRAGGEHLVRHFVVLQRQADLHEVVLALHPAGRFAGLLHRREQQGDQNGDDRNHDQQLNQGEAAPAAWSRVEG